MVSKTTSWGYEIVDSASNKPGDLAGTSADEEGVRALDIAVVIVTYRSAPLTIESLRSVQAERSSSGLRVRAVVVDIHE